MADGGAAGADVFHHHRGCALHHHAALVLQHGKIAFAAGAEAEIVADQQILGVEALPQQAADECLCADVGKSLIEAQHPHRIKAAGVAQKLQFAAQRREPVRQLAAELAGEKFLRLRLKHNRHGR